MKSEIGIYKIENTDNHNVYIGQSTNLHKRILAHKNFLKQGIHYNEHLQNAYNKYGEESFDYSIIEFCGVDDLDSQERYWIDYYDSYKKGYNQTIGGQGTIGYVYTAEQMKKIASNRKDMSGVNNPMYGKSWKDYTTPDIIAEHNRKIKEHSMLNAPRKKVVCLNTGVIYNSFKEAAQENGISSSGITGNCQGRSGYAGKCNGKNLAWAYYSDYINMSQNDIDNKIERAQKRYNGADNPNSKKIVNLNTGEIFNCLKDAANKYKINDSTLSNCVNRKILSCGKLENKETMVWRFYNEYINMTDNEILNDIEKAQKANKGENNPNSRGVICLTLNQKFISAADAGKTLHVDISGIIKCCKGKARCAGKVNGEPLVWSYSD